ncbi:unnamed protein product [Agarophyton chilense]
MDEWIDSLGEANVFTTLDANSGYGQVPVAEEDQYKTAFACHAGLYRFKRMPFGLTNAPATFQRTLNIFLSRYKWKTCLVYLDDVIIFSQDVESHLRHVEEIFKALQSTGITLKFKKCEWFFGTVPYLGHVIKPGQLAIQEAQTVALREVQPPSTQKQLRSFLGLYNVYRRFVPRYSHIAAPLNAKLRNGQPVQLEQFRQAEVEAFDTLKTKIISAPVLALPIPNLPYSVDTDSSEYQVRSLNAAEKKYSVSEKECLAVVSALTTLRPYLQKERFTVNTDHSPLRWLLSITDPSGRLTRWRLRLSEFDFEVKYKKGLVNFEADALSRLKTMGETQGELDEEIPCFYMETHSPSFEEEEQETLDDY